MATVKVSLQLPKWKLPSFSGRAFVRFINENLYYIVVVAIAITLVAGVLLEVPLPQEWYAGPR
jgi:hypothetical protein